MPRYPSVLFSSLILGAASLVAAASEISVTGAPPESVTVGEYYYFVPTAANANTAELEFSYINKPDWSGSYRSSGALIGTPAVPGVYPDIQIEAWDGVHFGISAPFTITVSAISASSVTLRWVRPSENTDGSVLTDLRGYLIRYGNRTGQLDNQLSIGSADSTTAELSDLTPGEWYFQIAAVSDANVRGPFSATARQTF